MNDKAKNFLKDLLNAPGPSGYEVPVQNVVRDYLADVADEITTDFHGNVIAVANPGTDIRVMYDGHADQIGLLVSQIDESGLIYFQTIGGWDPQVLVGQRVTVWSESGGIPGVVARKAIHLQDESERKQVTKAKDLWIDIGSFSRSETEEIVKIGDPVTMQLGMQEMRNGLANAPAMDNRTGLWVCVEAFVRATAKSLPCSLYLASTVQEEIGLRGAKTSAFSIDPHIGIAVDVTHATDCPTIDKRQRGEVNMGEGPVVFRGANMNPVVSKRLMEIGDQHEIPYQVVALAHGASNDSNAIQLNRGGVATGLVSIPNRYMHSPVEVISLEDIDNAADMLCEFALTCDNTDDFIPR